MDARAVTKGGMIRAADVVRHESDYLAITTVVQELLSLGKSRFAAMRIGCSTAPCRFTISSLRPWTINFTRFLDDYAKRRTLLTPISLTLMQRAAMAKRAALRGEMGRSR